MKAVCFRQADPKAVQVLWEAITNVRQQKQVANLERIARYLIRQHGYAYKYVQQQLALAVKDELVVKDISRSKKGSRAGSEQEGFWCVKAQEEESDASHDWYCIECHKGGDVVCCSSCHRVCHIECLAEEDQEKQEWTCQVCQGGKKCKLGLSKSEISDMISHVLARMKEKAARELQKKLNLDDMPNYYNLVYKHMDFNIMMQKIENEEYQTLEEFQGDAETVLHVAAVYHGVDSDKAELCRIVLEDCKYDLDEVRICKDCYEASNSRKDSMWFCRPCDPVHEAVWAQLKGFGYWPAKVLRKQAGQVDVRFFGSRHQRAWISEVNIKPIDTNVKTINVKMTSSWKNAKKEMDNYMKNCGIKKPRKRPREENSSESEQSISSSINIPNADQDHAVSTSQALSEDEPPALKKCRNINVVEELTPVINKESGCECHEKYSTIFSDFKARLELEHQTSKERAVTSAVDKLKKKMEEEKKKAVLAERESMQKELTRITEEFDRYKEETEEEAKLLMEKHREEISNTKKRQWCINCEQEAMYHCCWNTSYCSINCQQGHWHKEHKKLCRRKR
ncbi:zinc finger MYND domain-containing protein 11-like [Anneissia japonica]|uniref:zinc finger MYND domain-containing protein 11-like n=1 Tax=Anneissia japonica TaxID=1529436 RepID=UPI0014257053|nr:zinc finger MYND domain-containing protein 11-like [Anneissia japonica]XP_033097951.1 zinc finger MYND domain-containing protein 11-like [Anneissia japonica]XP_033097960.1 zinc finger MYND domain-containing protein 11-like [Anneissia japonica]